jgi:hypothetical protein
MGYSTHPSQILIYFHHFIVLLSSHVDTFEGDQPYGWPRKAWGLTRNIHSEPMSRAPNHVIGSETIISSEA